MFRVRNSAEDIDAERGVFRDRGTGEASAGRAAVHYYMDPRDQLRVYNELDELDLDVVGYYHSHTHTEARPISDRHPAGDRPAAVVYVLVSLGRRAARRARLADREADPDDETGELVELASLKEVIGDR